MPPLSLARRGLLSALVVCAIGATAQARVTDPNVVNTFDLRFDLGLATPVGAAGGTFSVPWRHVAADLSAGLGATGLNLSAMPKIVPFRWDRNAILIGGAFTITLPHQAAPMGRKRATFITAEVAYQRTVFIDNILYLGLGVTRGSYWGQCQNTMNTKCPAEEKVLWPEIRIGFGRRY